MESLDDDGMDFRNPIEREVIIEQRRIEVQERAQENKQRNRTYLKGRYGKRLYYDFEKRYKYTDEYDDYNDDEEDEETIGKIRQVKCVFTKDLRREKLYAYLKYLKGKKVLVRDLAWKFAVTERTIQNDIKFLVEQKLVEVKTNKTTNGKQTKNSYIVKNDTNNLLPCKNNWLYVVFLTKENSIWYVLTKSEYKGRDKKYSDKDHKTIKQYSFDLFGQKITNTNQIDQVSIDISQKVFGDNLFAYYKGHSYTILQQGYLRRYDKYKQKTSVPYKNKNIYTYFILDDKLPTRTSSYWLKLSVAPRRMRSRPNNKCLKHIVQNILG